MAPGEIFDRGGFRVQSVIRQVPTVVRRPIVVGHVCSLIAPPQQWFFCCRPLMTWLLRHSSDLVYISALSRNIHEWRL